jgi:hypothetical protein
VGRRWNHVYKAWLKSHPSSHADYSPNGEIMSRMPVPDRIQCPPVEQQELFPEQETTQWGDTVVPDPVSGAKKADALTNCAIKNDAGKPRIDLLPVQPLLDTAKIFAFGAAKYTKTVDLDNNSALQYLKGELLKCETVMTVLANTMQKEDVEGVMKKTFENLIQNTLSAKGRTLVDGEQIIPNVLRRRGKSVWPAQNSESETLTLKSESNCAIKDLQKSQLICYYNSNQIAAQSAKEILMSAPSTLIIHTRQNLQEAIFVVGATTDWECLATLLLALKKHFNTSLTHQLRTLSIGKGDPISLTISGERNWEQGFQWSRTYAALQRHLMAWWAGENTDDESGQSHLAHAMCNLMFLMEFENTHGERDDRPIRKPDTTRR